MDLKWSSIVSFDNNPARLDRSVKYGESDAINFSFTDRLGTKNKSMIGYKLIFTVRKNNFDKNILLRKEYDLQSYAQVINIKPSDIRSLGSDGTYWYDAWLEHETNIDYEEPLVFGRYNINYLSKKERV